MQLLTKEIHAHNCLHSMTTNALSPVTPLTIFARIEPTCDAIVQRYAEQPDRWCDIVFYRDANATQPYARSCARLCVRQRQAQVVTLNCFSWRVVWLLDTPEM